MATSEYIFNKSVLDVVQLNKYLLTNIGSNFKYISYKSDTETLTVVTDSSITQSTVQSFLDSYLNPNLVTLGGIQTAETVYSDNFTSFTPTSNVKFSTTISVENHKIVNLTTPTQDLDAANKIYVDTKVHDAVIYGSNSASFYNGPTQVTGTKIWSFGTLCNNGVATAYLTVDGTLTGAALYTNIIFASASAVVETNNAPLVAFCGIKSISSNLKKIEFTVVTGSNVKNSVSPTTMYAPNNTPVKLLVFGVDSNNVSSTNSSLYYNGPTQLVGTKMWSFQTVCTNGFATAYLTTDGTETGTALFTNIIYASGSAFVETTQSVLVAICGINFISSDQKTIKFSVVTGTNISSASSSSTQLAPNGTTVSILVFGS